MSKFIAHPKGLSQRKYLLFFNRDMEILEMRVRNYTYRQIADRFGLSMTRVQQIIYKLIDMGLTSEEDLPKGQAKFQKEPFVSTINVFTT